jgi:NAD+ synthase (glutamine-hydrolysing)
MKLVKVAAAVLNQTPRDWKGNMANILGAVESARSQGVTVLCLPEATITGYGLEDDLFCADVPRRAMLKLKELAKALWTPVPGREMIVCVGLPVRFNNTLYNAVATIVNGTVIGFTCKQHLAGDGIHYEPRHYKPWPAGVMQMMTAPELDEVELYPIGDVHFNIGGVKIGYEICEDAWVANRPGTVLATKGIDIFLNPSASHFSFGKLNTRKNFVVDGSRAFSATYIYANLVGNESGRAIFDGGALIATGGSLVAQGKRFTFQNWLLTTAVIDIDNTRTSQVRTASFMPDVEKYNEGCITVPFTYPYVREAVTTTPKQEAWESLTDVKHEECTRAIGLALMDYMRKSRTKGFVISLSGGADSAMVTYLCARGIELAVEELGVTLFLTKYAPHFKPHEANDFNKWSEHEKIKHIAWHLITTAYQPTENSGAVTRNAAAALAEAVNVPHYVLDVDPMFKEYLKVGAMVKGRALNFQDDDIVMQNLQARVRAPSIWMIANMEGKLLLTTSNMSEAAVGYATMDGDTAGCVAPISGLPKVYIREYLRWVEKGLPEMRYINNQQPTAELRPSASKQTDEDDLMPYWLLHRIETMVVKNRYIPVEIYQALRQDPTTTIENNQLIGYITKFFRLFSINQWKRERYALGFHMDDHNLDPRTWCRTPILTGGYEEELAELQTYKTKA